MPSVNEQSEGKEGMRLYMDINVLNNLSYGMYVISAKDNDRNIGCFVNTVVQITADNPTVAISINKQNYTNEIIKKNKKFSISILSETTDPTIIGKFGFFSSRDTDKFSDVKYDFLDELPILTENICGNIICELINVVDVETHDIFIARVIDTKAYENSLTPMTYKYYHDVIKGKAPKTAPTYIETKSSLNDDIQTKLVDDIEEKQNVRNEYKKYRCTICGHIYDEEVEKVKFEDLPSDWVCPICQVGKELFELVK